MQNNKKLRILVDMDGVLADYSTGFYQYWKQHHPEFPAIHPDTMDSFYIETFYPESYRKAVEELDEMPGFFLDLPVIAGGKQALEIMRDMGHDVFICTKPIKQYTHCVPEKYQWIDQHLGRDWVQKIIMTRDKTLVTGDILIDDNPDILGICEPVWEHVVYDRLYNRHKNGHRRITWDNWREVLGI